MTHKNITTLAISSINLTFYYNAKFDFNETRSHARSSTTALRRDQVNKQQVYLKFQDSPLRDENCLLCVIKFANSLHELLFFILMWIFARGKFSERWDEKKLQSDLFESWQFQWNKINQMSECNNRYVPYLMRNGNIKFL